MACAALVLIVLAGCAGADSTTQDDPITLNDSVARADTIAPADSSTVELPTYDSRVAIFIEATQDDIERARAESSEDDFAVMADDMMYYRSVAQEYLEKRRVVIVRLTGRRPLPFLVAGQRRVYDYSHAPTLDVIVLYEPGKEPRAIAPIDTHVVDEYFSGFSSPR